MTERYSTVEALLYGILSRPAPVDLCPHGAVLAGINDERSTDDYESMLEAGGIDYHASYGIWQIWKKEDGTFGGQLLQYRVTTDQFDGLSLQDALAKARGWHAQCME